jgi:threonine/homoserine/homoserine lactone efflux protein
MVVPVDGLLGFAAMSLVLVLIPGPGVLFVLGRAPAHGRRTALGGVLGNSVGACALAFLVSVGFLGPASGRAARLSATAGRVARRADR